MLYPIALATPKEIRILPAKIIKIETFLLNLIFDIKKYCEKTIKIDIIAYRAFVKNETIIPDKIIIGVAILLRLKEFNNMAINIGNDIPKEFKSTQL